MTSQPITPEQKDQLRLFLEDTFTGVARLAFDQVSFDDNATQYFFERRDKFGGEIERVIIAILRKFGSRYPVIDETDLLKPIATSVVRARNSPFDASAFYQNRPGLCIWNSTRGWFGGEERSLMRSVTDRPYVSSLLKRNANDQEIWKELPEKHLSTLEDIAGLIEAQPGGKWGFLLNNGYVNVFYVEGRNGLVFAVGVYWDEGIHSWVVRYWRLDEDGVWDTGCRIVCPGNISTEL